jgi:hypothetical protein
MRGTWFSIVAAVVALTAVGCGGGGGSNSGSSILYQTEWSGGGASQRITLMRADGTVVSQKVLNSGSNASTQVRLSTPSAKGSGDNSFRIRAELNSAPDFSGTTTGVLEAAANSGETVRSTTASVTSTLRIEPNNPIVPRGGQLKMAAAFVAPDGRRTFVSPSTVTWRVDAPCATVSADGMVTGVEFGDFVVTAEHEATARSAQASASVAQSGAVRSKWTVFVFLSAANNLYPFSEPNVQQMERVASDDVRFVVQWKQSKAEYPQASFDGTRRYLVQHDKSERLASRLVQDLGGGIDMGSPTALRDFIQWGKANYPADRYAIILWSHGDGWRGDLRVEATRAISYDDEFFSSIKIWDLPGALQGHHFDIFSFDACLMQMLEVGVEIEPFCDYIVASAENTPAAGYPYDRIFNAFSDNPDAPTETLAEAFVTGHVGNPSYQNQYVTQSVVDARRLGAVQTAVDGLGASLLDHNETLKGFFPALREEAPKYGFRSDGRYFYDLVDIAQRLIADPRTPAEVKEKAQGAIAATQQAVLASDGTPLNDWTHGLALDFSPGTSFRPNSYAKLKFAQNTQWDEWLKVAP